jgi:tetratricopeptide (TPR) repeat protein
MREKMDEPGGLFDLMVQIYNNHFSHKEIKGLLEFYQTELGKKAIRVMPQLMNDSMIAGQQWAQRTMPILYGNVRRRCKEEGIELPKLPPGGQSGAKQYLARGVDYAAQGQFSEAKEEFEEALKVDPFNLSAKESLKVVEDVIDRKIESKAVICLFRGGTYGLKGQWDEAIAEYNEAIEVNPNFAMAYRTKGTAYLKKGQYDQAISDFNKAIKIHQKYGIAYYQRGFAYYYKGEYDDAWEDVHKAQMLGCHVSPRFLDALRKASGRQE